MQAFFRIIAGITLGTVLSAQAMAGNLQLQSPNGKLRLEVGLTEKGRPVYSLQFNRQPVILTSGLGLELKNVPSLVEGFTIRDSIYHQKDETWTPVWGEVSKIADRHNELVVVFHQEKEDRVMRMRFRLFDDGLGFRYEFDKQPNLNYFLVTDEHTEFALSGNHTAFWIPGDYDTNEYYYTKTRLLDVDASTVDGTGIGTHGYFHNHAVQSPLMMKTDEGLYINIFEAALIDYPAMHLMIDKKRMVLTSSLTPDALGTKAYMQTPHHTPWRTVIVSDKATDIVASKLILNLNEPSSIEDPSYIRPQKYIGIWWGMHVPNTMSWNYAHEPNIRLETTDWNALQPLPQHGASNKNVRRYIDFAAEHGFSSVLVEGWNVGWEDWAGNWKEEVFDFVTPYPDFDIKALNEYARSKGVKLMMHHETSSSVTNYERRIDKAIELMQQHGYDAVKTGYVGWIIPRGEKHDGQWMVNHFIRVAEKMAGARIMLNAHEAVRPTGLHRTWPNWVACEAARGNEFNAWSAGNPPAHETILPFTRLMGGPMDYTPGIFELKMDYYQPGNTNQVHTTLAKQLALYVTMYSPIQMAADLPENYEKRMDAFQFIKDVAVDWDDSRYLEAEPGEYLTVARKAKGSNDWFAGAITNENARTATLDLSFLDPGASYEATIYADAKNAHWQHNPGAYAIRRQKVNSKTVLKQALAPGGGVAISIKKSK